jgi:exopolysaccharide biosynthesis WecB/TagA/CpsF family protein
LQNTLSTISEISEFELQSKEESPPAALAYLDGWGINTPNMDAAIVAIIRKARAATAFTVFTLNLDHLVKLRRDKRFRHAYQNANIITADGAPVAWLARLQNKIIAQVTGSDMLVPLLEAAADADLPVFFFGSSGDVLTKAARKLTDCTDGRLDIVGTLSPSQTFNPEGPEADMAIESIVRSGARICIVALGAPKQEIFAERARAKGIACGMVCAGASLDFIAGAQIRAPRIFRTCGLEWLWRLVTDPRRLAKRYAECAIVLADLAVFKPAWRHFFN